MLEFTVISAGPRVLDPYQFTERLEFHILNIKQYYTTLVLYVRLSSLDSIRCIHAMTPASSAMLMIPKITRALTSVELPHNPFTFLILAVDVEESP